MPNGFVYRDLLVGGNGRLTIANGTDSHAVAKLVDMRQRQSVHTVLIRSRENATIPRIPDGSYRLLFALGKGWDDERQRFYESNRYAEFQRPLAFKTTHRTEGERVYDYYSEMEVTLHRVVGGTARTDDIPEAEFAKY